MKRSARTVCATLIVLLIAQAFSGCRFISSPQFVELNSPVPVPTVFNTASATSDTVFGTDIPSPYFSSYPYPTGMSESSSPFIYPSFDPASTAWLTPTNDPVVTDGTPFMETPSLTAPQTPGASPSPALFNTPSPTPWNASTPTPITTNTPKPTPIPTPRPTQPVFTTPDPNVPFDQIQPGDQRIFDYCAFFGNSLFDSLFYNRVVTHGAFFTRVGLTVNTAYTLPSTYGSIPVIDELNSGSYRGILLMFGQNELGWISHSFRIRYSRLIEDVHSRQPQATLLLAGMPPLSKYLSQTSTDGSTNENVNIFNNIIRELASSCDYCRYIEPPATLYDSEGYLPIGASADGMHLNRTYLALWAEQLCISTVNELIPTTVTPTPSPTPEPSPTYSPSPAPSDTPEPMPTPIPFPTPSSAPEPTLPPIVTYPPIETDVPTEMPEPTYPVITAKP